MNPWSQNELQETFKQLDRIVDDSIYVVLSLDEGKYSVLNFFQEHNILTKYSTWSFHIYESRMLPDPKPRYIQPGDGHNYRTTILFTRKADELVSL